MHKPVRSAISSTLYPKKYFIQIAHYRRSSLDSRGIFDSGRSLQIEFILLNISHTTFRHCHEHSYHSLGQPFPKQLYSFLKEKLISLPLWKKTGMKSAITVEMTQLLVISS